MNIELPNSGKVVSKFKNDLSDTLNNIHVNCYVIISNHDCVDTISLSKQLQIEIIDIMEWYSNCKTKEDVLLYLRDYEIIDKKFNKILEDLDDDFDYFLCLLENRFKLIYKGESDE